MRNSKKYIPVKDLLDKGLEGFEFFDLVKRKVLQVSEPITGRAIVDEDDFERAPRLTYEQVEANQRAKQHARVLGAGPGSGGFPASEWEIKQRTKMIYDRQPLEIINPPKDCILKRLTLSSNMPEALKQITEAKTWIVKRNDVLKSEEIRHLIQKNGDASSDLKDAPISETAPAPKKLRPSQRHRLACRKIAKELWDSEEKNNYTITPIAAMIDKQELIDVCEKKIYSEKTMRNWIKDLCPSRLPGRRPQKK